MRLDGPAGDGKPETEAGGLSVCGAAEKGLENRLQLPFWNTRSAVRDGDEDALGIGKPCERYLDRAPLGGKPDGVATDILEGTVQYLRAASDDCLAGAGEEDAASGRLGLEPRILGDLARQVRQVDRLVRLPTHSDLEPRERQQLSDQLIQPDRLMLDPIQLDPIQLDPLQ